MAAPATLTQSDLTCARGRAGLCTGCVPATPVGGSDAFSAEVQGHEAQAHCARGPAMAANPAAAEATFISRPKSRNVHESHRSKPRLGGHRCALSMWLARLCTPAQSALLWIGPPRSCIVENRAIGVRRLSPIRLPLARFTYATAARGGQLLGLATSASANAERVGSGGLSMT